MRKPRRYSALQLARLVGARYLSPEEAAVIMERQIWEAKPWWERALRSLIWRR